jgi:hypothetical protein
MWSQVSKACQSLIVKNIQLSRIILVWYCHLWVGVIQNFIFPKNSCGITTISQNDRMKRRLVSLAVLVYQHIVIDITYRATLKVVHISKSLMCVIWRKQTNVWGRYCHFGVARIEIQLIRRVQSNKYDMQWISVIMQVSCHKLFFCLMFLSIFVTK